MVTNAYYYLPLVTVSYRTVTGEWLEKGGEGGRKIFIRESRELRQLKNRSHIGGAKLRMHSGVGRTRAKKGFDCPIGAGRDSAGF
jgi:hypothetical protein